MISSLNFKLDNIKTRALVPWCHLIQIFKFDIDHFKKIK